MFHSFKAEDTLRDVFTAFTWAVETYTVLLLRPTPTGLLGNLCSRDQTSTKHFPTQSFHLEDVWKPVSACHQPVRRRYSTLSSCWNSAGQNCLEMVDEGEQGCGLCCWARSQVLLLQLMVYLELNCNLRHTDIPIWALAQLELDTSESMATWRTEAMLSFHIWIWWTYWPKATVSKSRQPGSAGVCWKVSLTIAFICTQTALFNCMVKWR